jgi:hypothetical protein
MHYRAESRQPDDGAWTGARLSNEELDMAMAVTFDAEAREALRRGMDALAEAVRVTLGPAGHTVFWTASSGCRW